MSYTGQLFDLTGRTAIITGGAGMLGVKHAEAIAEMQGIPILMDLPSAQPHKTAERIARDFGVSAYGFDVDITQKEQVQQAVGAAYERFKRIDILINNAAFTGKGQTIDGLYAPFEDYPLDLWIKALEVNLTGTFLVTQAVGKIMRSARSGVILNIASDVGVVSPNHRIYENLPEGKSFNTPIAYATTKAAILNFTRYLATYWAPYNIRVNSLSPAGVFDNQDPEFVHRLSGLIPLGRMAHKDEYKGAIIFLVSDASSFMTGANLIVDGGRTCW